MYSSIRKNDSIRRVGILFAGGPAPAANAVISTAAAAFLRNGIHVTGILNGYSNLVDYSPENPLRVGSALPKPGRPGAEAHAEFAGDHDRHGAQQTRARTSVRRPTWTIPSAVRRCAASTKACARWRSMRSSRSAATTRSKTANKFKLYQDRLPADAPRIPVVHLPKTIDNDYMGIDFTFGYFTAVEFLASEIRNLIYDAEASSSYFLCEVMGRSAGWLAYGAAIAGEASLVISVEDICRTSIAAEESYVDPQTGRDRSRARS